MKTSVNRYAAAFGLRKSTGVIVAAMLAAAAVSGWAVGGPSQVASIMGSGHYELPPLW
jgi:hypothetical protein